MSCSRGKLIGLRLGLAAALGSEPYGVELALAATVVSVSGVELVILGFHKNATKLKSSRFSYALSASAQQNHLFKRCILRVHPHCHKYA